MAIASAGLAALVFVRGSYVEVIARGHITGPWKKAFTLVFSLSDPESDQSGFSSVDCFHSSSQAF